MSIFSFVKSHLVVVSGILVVAVAGMVIAGRVANRSSMSDAGGTADKRVSLVNVTEYRSDQSSVSADGVVESVSQVDLKSQLSAPIALVNVSIGDTVSTGETIAELENADIRAQLEQARATLALAEGQYTTGTVSLESAQKSALDKLRDTYAKADEVVHGQIDTFLYSSGLSVSSYFSDQEIEEDARTARIMLDPALRDWKRALDTTTAASSDADILAALGIADRALGLADRLLGDIATTLNDLAVNSTAEISTTVSGWRTTVSSARATVNGAQASITAAESALSSAKASQESPAEAQISVARAGVKNLEAQFAKTVIRSPISGTIAALPLRAGELATPGQLIATVVGSGGLQIRAYASGEDIGRIQKGASVRIGASGSSVSGTVASVAPSVNPANKKVEIKVLVSNPASSSLVIGDSVQVSIAAATNAASSGTQASVPSSYLLPIQNVKIVPGDAYVFTVDDQSRLVRVPVTLGRVSGDFVEVKAGLSDGMEIVSPVYELEEGQTVVVR